VLKRASLPAGSFPPFYLYVDEFQNMTTDTFASMLSESRKYGLGVHLTNQYFAQLPENIQDAVLGNVGTLLTFQLGIEDAERLQREFHPFSKEDLSNLERFHFYIKLTSGGKSTPPFSGLSLAPMDILQNTGGDAVKSLSRLAYAHPRLLVEQQLSQRLKI